MKIDKTKKQKEVVRFMEKPHYGQYLGLRVDSSTDVEDEEIVDEENYKATIKQKIKGFVFTTEIKIENKLNGSDTETFTRTKTVLKEGQILIWYPKRGYIVPNIEFKTVDEVKEDLKCLDFSDNNLEKG